MARAGTRCRTKRPKSRRLLSGARPKEQILDLCAGAGGKTLALAAAMENTGQLYAYDADRMRLRPIFERLKRARRAQRSGAAGPATPNALATLEGKMDRVLVDAPCTGSGVWRRRPDAKWRLSPQMLEASLAEQRAVLDQAAASGEARRPASSMSPARCFPRKIATRSMASSAATPASGSSPGARFGKRVFSPRRHLPPTAPPRRC